MNAEQASRCSGVEGNPSLDESGDGHGGLREILGFGEIVTD